MARVQLNAIQAIILSAGGVGIAKVGPESAREIWYPEVVSVNANTNATNEALCQVFVGSGYLLPGPQLLTLTARQIDITNSGSQGDATASVKGCTVKKGEFVWAIWTGGDANVQARLVVTGWRDV